ncbi:MAG: hypothetical protein ACREL5_14115 [Gemmatimonadales bacterium]
MRSSIAVLIVLAAATAACGRKGARSSDFDSATAAALGSGTPAGSTGVTSSPPSVARAMGFEFGHRIDRYGRVEGGVASQFAPTDSVLMTVRAAGADTSTEVSARIRFGGKTVDSQAVKAARPDSTGVSFTPLRFGFAKPLATGNYQVDVFVNGKFQMSQDMTVGQ